MLIIKNLTKIYTSEKGLPIEALSNVSAKFGEKGLIFLTGKSGSGKSTMLNLLGGLDVPSSGEIIINNRSSISFKEKDFDSYRNTYVGFIFQEYNLIENFTVGANIGLALELQGKKPDRNDIEKILRKVDLVEHGGTLYNRYVDELSGGQKQRVAIARALIKNPEVILADEPTGALDTKTGQQLYELLKELAKEKLIIVVSHDIKNAKKYADGVIKLHDGKIISNTINVDDSSQLKTPTNFKKSELRFKRSFAMGVKALKAKPIRLVISLLLLITTNVIFGFSLTLNTSSKIDAELNALYENNQSMVTLTGCAVDSNNNIVCQYRNFTDTQMDLIKKYNNNVEPMHAFPYPINHEKVFYDDYIGSLPEHAYFSKAEDILGHGIQDPMSVVEVDYETGESDAKLTPDSRFINQALCRLPITNNEIAITDLYADIFMGRGYKNGKQSNHVISINSPDDLIGLTLGGLTICGVYSTEQNFLDWNTLPMMFDHYSSLYEGGLFVSMLTKGFVCKGYGGNSSVSGVLLELSGDIQKDRALINKLTYKIGRDTFSTVRLESVYTLLASALYSYQDTTYYATIIIALILSAIFAVLLTMNFLSASMDSKKKEIGILRALGAREKDIQMICLTESIVVASIQFIVSLIVLFILCNYVNGFFIPLLVVDFIPIGGLLLLSFGLSTLATIKPVRKLAKYKPIYIIINKDK